MKTTLIGAVIGFIVGGMISAAIFGDEGAGIELRHLAIALPLSIAAAVIGHVMGNRQPDPPDRHARDASHAPLGDPRSTDGQ